MDNNTITGSKAIVIANSDIISLCTIRAIGAIGYSVDVIRICGKYDNYVKTIDYYSKYVDKYYCFVLPSKVSLSGFLLEKYKNTNQKPVIFTLGDRSTYLIDRDRDSLKDRFLFAHLDNGQGIAEVMNKHTVKTQAEAVGLAVAKGWPIPYENGAFSIPDDITFPCFLKGLYSYWNSKDIQKRCDNRSELVLSLEHCKSIYPHSVYAEEYVNIEKELGIMGVCDGNKCIIPAITELLVMGKGSSHGVSILGHIEPIVEEDTMQKKIEELLLKLHYIGIFNIDLIKTKDQFMFVELNLRYATYGYALFRAGVNIPELFISVLLKQINSNLSTQLNGEYYYLNEAVAFNNIAEGELSRKDYLELKKKADILFVESSDDPKPMKHFNSSLKLQQMLALFRKTTKTLFRANKV